MMNRYEELRNRCNELLNSAIEKNNADLINRLTTIKNFLTNNRGFFQINREVALNILMCLNYSVEEAFTIYDEIVSPENFKNTFKLK